MIQNNFNLNFIPSFFWKKKNYHLQKKCLNPPPCIVNVNWQYLIFFAICNFFFQIPYLHVCTCYNIIIYSLSNKNNFLLEILLCLQLIFVCLTWRLAILKINTCIYMGIKWILGLRYTIDNLFSLQPWHKKVLSENSL